MIRRRRDESPNEPALLGRETRVLFPEQRHGQKESRSKGEIQKESSEEKSRRENSNQESCIEKESRKKEVSKEKGGEEIIS